VSRTTTRPPSSGPWQDASGEEGRTEPPSLVAWEAPVSPPPPGEVSLPVLLTLEEARAAPTRAQRAGGAARINQQLDTLEAGGSGRQVADLLHELLESGRLAGLEDAEGRTCRAAATEALLRLGYPFALEVRPEDLEHLRGLDKDGRRFPWASVAAGGTMAAGLLGQWVALPRELFTGENGEQVLPLILLMGLSMLGLVPALLGAERSDARRAGLLGLFMLALVQLYLGVSGDYYGTLSGTAGLLAWLLLLLPRR
jgi:hypothetical protein